MQAPVRMTLSSSAQSNGSGGRDSIYSHARASVLTSTLMLSAVAKRVSMLAAANKGASGSATDLLQCSQGHAKNKDSATSSSDNDSSDLNEDSDDALLSRLVQLRHPGSAASTRTGSGDTLHKPQGVHEDDNRDSGACKLPTRSQTAPADTLLLLSTSPASFMSAIVPASPTPPASPASASPPMPPSLTATQKLNGRSLSTPDAGALAGEGVKVLSDPVPIVPMPIRECSPPPAFSVTLHPTSQLGLASHTQFAGVQGHSPQQQQQQVQQSTVHSPSQPPPSPPTLPSATARAGRQPLIPDGSMPPSKGFMGSGLLTSTAGNPTTPSSPPAPTLRAACHHSVTASQASDTPREDQPQALRPFAWLLRRTGSPARQANVGPGSGSGSRSGVTSSSASSLSLTAPAQPAALQA
ncbi:hypothetical protein AcW1_002467 [Taiwanofungus camphoratus]|nr:hypothetical protein AcW1_002467 [Antrodia cinnamomea]